MRPQAAPTRLFFFIRSTNILTESGPKSTSPSIDNINVFSAWMKYETLEYFDLNLILTD